MIGFKAFTGFVVNTKPLVCTRSSSTGDLLGMPTYLTLGFVRRCHGPSSRSASMLMQPSALLQPCFLALNTGLQV